VTVYPGPPDSADWDKAAAAAAVTQLTNIRDLSAKWTASVTALIGVFGSVTIIGGTSALSEVRWQPLRIGLLVMTGLAGVAAGISVFTGAKAANGANPVPHDRFDGETLRQLVYDETPGAIRNLGHSKLSGYIAAVLVFATGLTSLVCATIPAASKPNQYIVVTSTAVTCGTLKLDNKGVVTNVGDQVMVSPQQILAVGNCSGRH
jgi:hypothetical protein